MRSRQGSRNGGQHRADGGGGKLAQAQVPRLSHMLGDLGPVPGRLVLGAIGQVPPERVTCGSGLSSAAATCWSTSSACARVWIVSS